MSMEAIRHVTVGAVLRQLARGAAPARTPLDELQVVRRALDAAGFEDTPRARRHELARLLVQLVEDELAHLRRLAGACRGSVAESGGRFTVGPLAGRGLPPAAYTDSPALLRERIRADYAFDHSTLEALSAIYHLYVRSDLGLALDDFVAVLGDRHRRTVQRRLSRGVAIVAERLRDRERAAWVEARRERLAARLPRGARQLFGFSDAVDALADDLTAGGLTLLGGEPGSGKSAFARAVVARLLDRDRLSDLVWIVVGEAHPDEMHIASAVERQLAEADARKPTRRLLVIDGLDTPAAARAGAAAAAAIGLPALLIGRATPAALRQGDARLITPPALDAKAARALLRQEMTRRGVACDERDWAPVVAAAAGHPRALRRAAAALRSAEPKEVAALFVAGHGQAGALFSRMWAEPWQAAPDAARESVRSVVALHRGGIVARAANVARLQGRSASGAAAGLEAALDAGLLIAAGEGVFQTPRFLRRWLRLAEAEVPPTASLRAGRPIELRGWERAARSGAVSAG